MKEYFYNIDTEGSFVTATIYYWEYHEIHKDGKNKRESCAKVFRGSGFMQFIKGYPKEEQLVEAKKWAITQCKIMNINQPD